MPDKKIKPVRKIPKTARKAEETIVILPEAKPAKVPEPAIIKTVVARASFVHNSPRKLRLVADAIRSLTPEKAVAYLKALPQAAAKPLLKVYLQGLGNAKNNMALSPGDLTVSSLQIEEGPRGPKKADVHAHGARFNRVVRRKRMAHIRLELTELHSSKVLKK